MAAPNLTPETPFLVFPNLSLHYPWRVIAVETGRTISRHSHLRTAVQKAEVLNIRSWTPAMPEAQYSTQTPIGMRSNLGSCQVWYDYSGQHANECDRLGAITDVETGQTFCVKCWRDNL